MPKRLLNKNFIFLNISVIVSIIVFAICWNIMKDIHILAKEDTVLSIIFFITLIISCICCLWIILITIEIIDIIDTEKCLMKIEDNLNNEYTTIYFKKDISQMISNEEDINKYYKVVAAIASNISFTLKAKIDNHMNIHLIVETNKGIIFEEEINNYKWFVENFLFNGEKTA